MKMYYPDGASSFSPDELKELLIPTISNRDELDRWEQDNILKAVDWVDKVEPDEILSESFMKRLLTSILFIMLAITAASTLHAASLEEVRESARQGDAKGQFRLAQRYEADCIFMTIPILQALVMRLRFREQLMNIITLLSS